LEAVHTKFKAGEVKIIVSVLIRRVQGPKNAREHEHGRADETAADPGMKEGPQFSLRIRRAPKREHPGLPMGRHGLLIGRGRLASESKQAVLFVF
jgi:hypothetical protein